jgi:hypothetical protein
MYLWKMSEKMEVNKIFERKFLLKLFHFSNNIEDKEWVKNELKENMDISHLEVKEQKIINEIYNLEVQDG